jgi:hypothetical protein
MENDKRESNKLGCNLVIDTNGDKPSIITDITGIKATNIFLKGSQCYTPNQKKVIPGRVHEFNIWEFNSEIIYGNDTIFINHAVESVVKMLDTKEKEFKEIFKIYTKSNLRCYAYFYEVNPYFNFTKEIIFKLASYNLSIDFDIYCLAGEEKESDITW